MNSRVLVLILVSCLHAPLIFAQSDLQTKAEAVIQASCGACHNTSSRLPPFVDDDGEVLWDEVEKDAERIIERLESPTRPMPPKGVPAAMQITEEQRADLIAYAQTLIEEDASNPLSQLRLPPGFKIEIFAETLGARSLAVHPSGVVFVGTGGFSNVDPQGRVFAIVPTASGRRVVAVARGLENPNGVAIHGNDLYVAEEARIIRFENAIAGAQGLAAGSTSTLPFTVIYDDFPRQSNHSWKYLAVGPDEKLYVPIGANCNVCLGDREKTAGIFRLNLDGSGFEQIAKGVRNTVGFDWHPETGELWFTDNGRDQLGDNIPPDELNRLSNMGADFGFPFCFGNAITDPQFGKNFSCQELRFSKPLVELGAHVASLGLTFYRGEAFPSSYRGQIFIAEHGSWNRSRKNGYRVTLVQAMPDGGYSYTPFITGWLNDATQQNWGRPVDVKTYIDGSLLLSDDQTGFIYRIFYQP